MPEQANNFPPLPKFLKVKPCFYQNISEEIPAQHQQLVRRIFILWMIYSVTLCLNVIGCIALWAAGGSGTNFGLALLWLILFGPASYACWFRPIYKAFRADSSFNFMAFFFIFFLQLVIAIIQCLGLLNWGVCGWFITITVFHYNIAAGSVMLLTTLLFTLVTVLMALVLIKVHRLYRGSGGSVTRAREEWGDGTWKNAAARGGFNTVDQNAQGPSLPEYPASVPSYVDNRGW
ncbi:secretory carrier-associated membrane protein 4 isoform X1 [Syngnathus acus]|uniref:secretory carrier-associated membrane protein 4 isoform X1 n=1 Tax=Syngnathus acus TaxID=161584 RepID=UPI001885C625|nr:secretory carrier-associated membrane protein 4 isoform X1 [Syngnathus acus]XP_037106132.1 secretory carrier-associated membrane protein 4 isoform X1 [Syngnathus acus]